MKKIDLTKQGGFPATQDTLAFMQRGYNDILSTLGRWLGSLVILEGCTDSGGIISSGWVAMNGEIMLCSGGTGTNVYVKETTQLALYQDGVSKQVYKTKTLEFGIGTPQYNWTNFKRLDKYIDLINRVQQNEDDIAAINTTPAGIIAMWSGSVTALPTGWLLCDGTNGTPNLSGKFIAGYSAADSDYNTIGTTGGEKRHTLTESEMPRHNHNNGNFDRLLQVTGSNTTQGVDGSASEPDIINTGSIQEKGSDQAHENRPPYYVLAYIIKT